jgi:hypothetical protein
VRTRDLRPQCGGSIWFARCLPGEMAETPWRWVAMWPAPALARRVIISPYSTEWMKLGNVGCGQRD